MNRIVLGGINGSNPLGFMASVGLIRLLDRASPTSRLGFLNDGTFAPFVEGFEGSIEELVARDAHGNEGPQAWRLEYVKAGDRKGKVVADLKPPPQVFATFVAEAIESWLRGDGAGAEYAAGFATPVAVDGKGNTKPTAFHFTAGQQNFLETVEACREQVTAEWARESLMVGRAGREGQNLRWDPDSDRNYALMASNPSDEKTTFDAALEWLAFQALRAFPNVPHGTRILTAATTGPKNELRFHWPLWSVAASARTVESLLVQGLDADDESLALRGVFAVCSSEIRRSPQGYGNFSPAKVTGVLARQA